MRGQAFNGIFVTGTDTGIGKSVASAALLHAMRARGLRAVGMKPVASGCVETPDGWRNEDALLLQAAGEPGVPYTDINPYALPAPLAPEIAADDAGIQLELGPIRDAFDRLAAQADRVVVEGVGGWAAPLSATLEQADLARALGLPVVLVVGLRLGCQSHARLTARAILADGLPLVGWIANDVDPDMERPEDVMALLARRLPAPCWGRLPNRVAPVPADLACHLTFPD